MILLLFVNSKYFRASVIYDGVGWVGGVSIRQGAFIRERILIQS